jgi:hypothetical protein
MSGAVRAAAALRVCTLACSFRGRYVAFSWLCGSVLGGLKFRNALDQSRDDAPIFPIGLFFLV